MRKLFFVLALITGMSVSASVMQTECAIFLYQEKIYKKIEVSQVSKEAMEKINRSYGSYTVKEAYRADDGEYKLVLNKDGIDTVATFTASGDLVKILK